MLVDATALLPMTHGTDLKGMLQDAQFGDELAQGYVCSEDMRTRVAEALLV